MDTLIQHRHNGYRLRVLPAFIAREFLDKCCRRIETEDGDCRHVPTSPQARIFRFRHNGKWFFHKTFNARNMLERPKSWARGTRAHRCARAHALLTENGFVAPKTIMVGQNGPHNFMVTAAVSDCISLGAFLQTRLSRAQKNATLERLGRLVGKLHAARIIHGDLLCGNILLSGDAHRFEVYFIDNERTKRHFIVPPRQRLKNLVQLNKYSSPGISNTGRMRFFNAYLSENPGLASDKKHWARKVIRRTAFRLERARKKRIAQPSTHPQPGNS